LQSDSDGKAASAPEKAKAGIGRVADAARGNWVDGLAPQSWRPYLRLARLDRPIGFWLLFWPCAYSVGLAAVGRPEAGFAWISVLLFLVGAIAMRGAGCTFNDLVDQDIDDKVARTRSRPLPSGQVTQNRAVIFLCLLMLVGLAILVQFNWFTIWLGIGSLGLVAIYPFMKRITYWPQLFLGLAFSWGAFMGWASELAALALPAFILYVGCICWVIGYDTIYALQDIEDDQLIGVKSTARLFGDRARIGIALFMAAGFGLWIVAALTAGAGPVFLVAAALPAAILAWEVLTLDPADHGNCLIRFKANHYVGLALTFALWAEYRF